MEHGARLRQGDGFHTKASLPDGVHHLGRESDAELLAAAGFAIYDLVRVLQKISQVGWLSFNGVPITQLKANSSVGWGLIVTVIAAFLALICAVSERRRS